MTELLPKGYFSDGSRLNAGAKSGQDQHVAIFYELLGGAAPTEVSIASGTITPGTGSPAQAGAAHLMVRTQNDAADDDLTNIVLDNYREGAMFMLCRPSGTGTTTIKHAAGGTGQFQMADGQDYVLADETLSILFQREGNAVKERARFYQSMTLAEANAGTLQAQRTISPQVLKQAIQAIGGGAFSQVETSAAQALAFNAETVFTMAFTPLLFRVFLRCLTAQHGYSVGDVVELPIGGTSALVDPSPAVRTEYGATGFIRGATVRVRIPPNTDSLSAVRVLSATFGWQTVTPANWELFVVAWA